jgi:hypothetical protein
VERREKCLDLGLDVVEAEGGLFGKVVQQPHGNLRAILEKNNIKLINIITINDKKKVV